VTSAGVVIGSGGVWVGGDRGGKENR